MKNKKLFILAGVLGLTFAGIAFTGAGKWIGDFTKAGRQLFGVTLNHDSAPELTDGNFDGQLLTAENEFVDIAIMSAEESEDGFIELPDEFSTVMNTTPLKGVSKITIEGNGMGCIAGVKDLSADAPVFSLYADLTNGPYVYELPITCEYIFIGGFLECEISSIKYDCLCTIETREDDGSLEVSSIDYKTNFEYTTTNARSLEAAKITSVFESELRAGVYYGFQGSGLDFTQFSLEADVYVYSKNKDSVLKSAVISDSILVDEVEVTGGTEYETWFHISVTTTVKTVDSIRIFLDCKTIGDYFLIDNVGLKMVS